MAWRGGVGGRAAAFYASLSGNAKVIFDLMIDRPGECLDADWLADQSGGGVPANLPTGGGLGFWKLERRQPASSGVRPPLPVLLVEGHGRSTHPVRDVRLHRVAALFPAARQGRMHP